MEVIASKSTASAETGSGRLSGSSNETQKGTRKRCTPGERRAAHRPSGVEGPAEPTTKQVRQRHLRELFQADPQRGERMAVEAEGIYLDYSKNRITDETLALLLQLAEESGLRARIDAMFRGEKINVTENRAVLHVALRAPQGATILVDGENVVPQVHAVLDKMADFSRRVRSGEWTGPHAESPFATSSTSASAAPTWGR